MLVWHALRQANTPEMFEAHYGIPMTGATLGCINIRLNATEVFFILKHSKPKVLLVDTEFAATMTAALEMLAVDGGTLPHVIDVCDVAGK
jgi:fatty-acyl-CoA synthase